jgi:uncharacterized protein involved in response to NO
MNTTTQHIFWSIGFRPFFFFGIAAAIILIPAWLFLFLTGNASGLYLPGSVWHGHEMIYGFATAIVLGFILTASQNWTGKPGINGPRLMALVSFWLLGRLLNAIPNVYPPLVAICDLALLPLATYFLVGYLGRSDQRHNIIFLVLLSTMAIGNLLVHLGSLGLFSGYEQTGLYLGLNVVVLMMAVIGGRVIPFFSSRVVPDYAKKTKNFEHHLTLASVGGYVLCSIFVPFSQLAAIFAAFAAIITFGRWWTWLHKGVWQRPILWVLYVGYLWLVVGFVLAALAGFGLVPITAAIHGFTAGAMATMIIGMVSRVSLGHTGRPIQASARTRAAYILIILSGIVRVVGAVLSNEDYFATLVVSGVFWTLSFVLLGTEYLPIFLKPRADAIKS